MEMHFKEFIISDNKEKIQPERVFQLLNTTRCVTDYSTMYWLADVVIDKQYLFRQNNAKSVFCFVIAPDMKHKGIATRLLEQVCHDAALEK